MTHGTRLHLFAAALLSASILFAVPASANDPRQTVDAYHAALLKALTATTGQPESARYKALEPAMDGAFDFVAMIKTAAGSAWRTASEAVQTRLADAFRRVSIATNANRFAPLKEASFEVSGVRDGPRGLKLVDSKLKPEGDDPVQLTYVLHEKDGGWRIVDVLLQGGISELAVRTSEYRRILKDGGDTALAAALEKQAAALLAN